MREHGIRHKEQISRRATAEDWKKQRQLFRERTKIKEIIAEHGDLDARGIFERVEATEIKIRQLVDEVEAIARHINIAKLLQSKGVRGLDATDPKDLKPSDIATFIRLGAEIERQAMNLAGETIDMDRLSREELERIANGRH
jgi:hypothetical protein